MASFSLFVIRETNKDSFCGFFLCLPQKAVKYSSV